ncbi:hypothetical protein [Muricoccus aerilatus]|uniref:hypothetical protein n=1 Tax=Muricoccus aerilatus TaxID=452982 RepID=UPI0005C1A37A|nr:hypothetical protein [Roseomonas aerilata]
MLFGASLAGAIAIALLFALRLSIMVPLGQGDGAYQTASGLHRLLDGQWPGRDFFPYLGLSLLYALFPAFLAGGGTMAASVFSAYFLVLLSFAFSVGLIAVLLARRLAVGTLIGVVLLCTAVLFYNSLPAEFVSRLTPGNSLRPLRACIPYIVAACFFGVARLPIRLRWKAGIIGAVIGFALTWATDNGPPTALVFGLLGMIWLFGQTGSFWRSLAIPAVSLGAAAVFSHCSPPVIRWNW